MRLQAFGLSPIGDMGGIDKEIRGKRYNSGMKKIISLFAFIGLALAIHPALATPGEVQIGSTLPEAYLQGLSGPSKKLSEFRGKPLIINVWASWCGPCREEMGSLQRLAKRYNGKQFNLIGISTDDYRDRAATFLKESNTTFSNFIDHDLIMENMLGANRIPLTILVDSKGKVIDMINGSWEWDSPEAIAFIKQAFHLKP